MTSALNVAPAARMSNLPPYFYHSLNQRLAELRAAGVDVIRMDAGSPDLPPAPFIVDALERSARNPHNHGYMPYGGIGEYRAAWAEFYGRRFGVELDANTEIVALIGSKEGIFHLHLAYVNPGDAVLVPDPGYAPYTAGTLFAGGEVVYLPLLARHHYLPDLSAIPEATLRRAKIMWLNYPNNPTGGVATPEFFAEVVGLAHRHNFIVAHDAPYTEITYDGYRAPSLLQIPGAREVSVEFHSLSKTYNMGGWRMGAACGSVEIIKALSTLKSNIDSSAFKGIQEAGIAALTGDQTWTLARNAHYRARRDLVLSAVREAGFEADTPKGAIYVWARLPEGRDDRDYTAALLEATGVSLTPGSVFGPSGRGYVRISLCLADARLQEAMQRVKQFGAEARITTR
jgi:LL-diaminopimelate aminotransferase